MLARGASPAPPWHMDQALTLYFTDESHRRATTIGVLSDDVLLEIFDFCRKNHYDDTRGRLVWKWHLLAQVCRRWRQIIFESPQRLNLQIRCTHRTPVRKNLGIWPPFPIVLILFSEGPLAPYNEDNAMTVLEHPGRISSVMLFVTESLLGKMTMAMQEPFPVLTRLEIFAKDGKSPVFPPEFLGGSAPSLQEIIFYGIPYPTLPTLLLSTSNLVSLNLRRIPQIGYISPELMVTTLAALPKLESCAIYFRSATSRPNRIRPPPVSRAVLPSLTSFHFQGSYEYLEDLIAQIDSPQLNQILISYLNEPGDFQVTQLTKFIDHSVGPESTLSRRAHVCFHFDRVAFTLYRTANHPGLDRRRVETTILSEGFHWRIPHMIRVLTQFSATFSNVIHLELELDTDFSEELGDPEDVDWLPLLRQFPAVQRLHVSWDLAWPLELSLEEITAEMVDDLFPFLDLICLVGREESSVEEIIAARRCSDLPVTFVNTTEEFNKILESYVSR
jgi:hypothetical protein